MSSGSPIENVPPTRMDRRQNNLDIMRLVAAIMVIFSHAFPIVGATEPRSFLNPTGHSWGNLGVLVFFSISGYLIAGSWVKDPSVGRYWAKRALRLVPGLIVATTLSAWMLGPFFTRLSPAEYFTSPGTWLYPFQETLLFVPPLFDLPGVFADNPMSDINASLWTLPVEVLCYLGVMLLFVLRMSKPVIVIACAVVLALLGAEGLHDALGLNLPLNAQMTQAATFGATFLVGTLLFLWKDQVKLHIGWGLGALAVAVAAGFTPAGGLIAPFLMAYAILSIGLSAPVLPLGKFRGWDLSYGTYIFAFPVEQAVRAATETTSPWVVAFISLALVLPLAALSWRLVEKPALALAPRPRAAAREGTRRAPAR